MTNLQQKQEQDPARPATSAGQARHAAPAARLGRAVRLGAGRGAGHVTLFAVVALGTGVQRDPEVFPD